MPAEITLDTVQDSVLTRYGPNQYRVIRGGLVTDVPSGDTTQAGFLYHIERLLNQAGIKYNDPHPEVANAFLHHIIIPGGLETGTNAARFQLIYEPFMAANPSALIVTIGGTMAPYVTDRIVVDGVAQPLFVGFNPVNTKYPIPEDLLKIQILRPMPTISVFRLSQGAPTVGKMRKAFNEAFGHVNKEQWMDRPRGSWLCINYVVRLARYAGYYTQEITALGRGEKEKWIEGGVLRSSQTGKVAGGGSDQDGGFVRQQIVDDLAAAYKHGIITPENLAKIHGAIHVGPYPLVDMAAVFGFSEDSSPAGINDPYGNWDGNWSFSGGFLNNP